MLGQRFLDLNGIVIAQNKIALDVRALNVGRPDDKGYQLRVEQLRDLGQIRLEGVAEGFGEVLGDRGGEDGGGDFLVYEIGFMVGTMSPRYLRCPLEGETTFRAENARCPILTFTLNVGGAE
jgi:hypothetical protein